MNVCSLFEDGHMAPFDRLLLPLGTSLRKTPLIVKHIPNLERLKCGGNRRAIEYGWKSMAVQQPTRAGGEKTSQLQELQVQGVLASEQAIRLLST